ncbi:MAG: acyl-CoA dehydrogenase [Candidatus Velthaea sp.]
MSDDDLRAQAAEIAAAYKNRHVPLTRAELGDIYGRLRPLGYFGSIIPKSAGGSGLTPLAFAAIVEGLAPDLTFVGNHSVQRYLHATGDAALCERFLPALFTGDAIAAIAITEDQAGSDLSRLQTMARRTAGGWTIDGVKTWVTHGLVADLIVVVAKNESDNGLIRFIVDIKSPGIRRTPRTPVGLQHLTVADVAFSGVEGPAGNRLREDDAASGTKSAFPIARALAALQALRTADAALHLALTFARERLLFGKRLSEFHLVQAKVADADARIRAARLLAYHVLAHLHESDADWIAAEAKFFGCETALTVCLLASEILGVHALAASHPVNDHINDVRMLAVADGPSVVNRLIAGRQLGRTR